MVKQERIKSLHDIHKRKKELKLEMELINREVAHGMGVMRTDLRSFALKKVALPAGGVLLALVVLKKVLSGGKKKNKFAGETRIIHEYPEGYVAEGEKKKSFFNFKNSMSIIRVLIPVVQAVAGGVAAYMGHQEGAEQARQDY
ncbi:MAG: hypothetical protein WBA17_16740 [Saprospiraceae bacterium]